MGGRSRKQPLLHRAQRNEVSYKLPRERQGLKVRGGVAEHQIVLMLLGCLSEDAHPLHQRQPTSVVGNVPADMSYSIRLLFNGARGHRMARSDETLVQVLCDGGSHSLRTGAGTDHITEQKD